MANDWKDLEQTIVIPKASLDPRILHNLKRGKPWYAGLAKKLLDTARKSVTRGR